MNAERFVSASELAEYAYCRRAWWLREMQGVVGDGESQRFEQGRAAHHRFLRRLALARALLVLAVSLAVVALLYWLASRR